MTEIKAKDWPIAGNKAAVDFLKRNIRYGKISQAYLFVGPRQVGKRTVADIFSKTIFCQDRVSKEQTIPCDTCANCDQFDKGIHSDFFVLEKPKDKKNIAVEQVRSFQHNLNTTSLLGEIKIGIIDNAGDLNEAGANALLKTIEEPPLGKVIIILTAESKDQLPATIVSRCQTILFHSVPTKEIQTYLEQIGCSTEKAEKIACLSFGRPGRAIDLAKHPLLLSQYEEALKEFMQAFNAEIPERFSVVQKYLEIKNYQARIKRAGELLNIWIVFIRDLILLKLQRWDLVIHKDYRKKIDELSSHYSLRELDKNLDALISLKDELTNNINPQLAFENYFLNLKLYA